MPEYCVSVGNSTTGPVGFVARIAAKDKQAALNTLKEWLPEWSSVLTDPVHLNVYFNSDALTIEDVEEDK
jgi:hypothetical protein